MAQVKKDFNYLSRDFTGFRQNIIDFTKQYFPDTYNDFNETSPGMMFIETSAMVGDILSYYTDHALRENMLQYAQEKSNVILQSRALGYKAKASVPSTVELDVFCVVPAVGSGTSTLPDMRYAPVVQDGMLCSVESDSTIKFTTLHEVDFSYTGSSDAQVSIFSIDDTSGLPTNYLLKKTVKAISGESVTENLTVTAPEKFLQQKLGADNVIQIIKVTDSDGDEWTEVDYLAQDTIFDQIHANEQVSPDRASDISTTPYLLKLRRTARRFTTTIDSGSHTILQFGAGISSNPDELLVPNPNTIGNVLNIGPAQDIDRSFDPANIMFTRAYGQAPANTTLAVEYLKGGGIKSNVPSGDINTIDSKTTVLTTDNLDVNIVTATLDSIAVTNPKAASGGKNAEDIDEIRYNALASYASQNRAVTLEDYISRVYSLPAKYGGIAKAHIVQNDQVNNSVEFENPLAMDLYVLSYNNDRKYTTTTSSTKENLQHYLSQYRLLTDAINIRDAFIVNFQLDFDIVPAVNENGKAVILRCIEAVKKYFDPDNWQINQPIYIRDLHAVLDDVPGVIMIQNIKFTNKFSVADGYSGISYNMSDATNKNVIYPSQDPMIWEIKFPDSDIKGRITGL
jgi:hypothetical protein